MLTNMPLNIFGMIPRSISPHLFISASVSGDVVFALGSSEVNGNIMTVNKYGDTMIGRHIVSDVTEDKQIFTNVTNNNITIGGTAGNNHSTTIIDGDLQANYNITTDADEDKEIFTSVVSKRIKIGGSVSGATPSKSTIEVDGDLQVNHHITTDVDENKNIFTGVTNNTIYILRLYINFFTCMLSFSLSILVVLL